MNTLLYLLKSAALLGLFLAVYELFLKRETFFTYNRIYLVSGLLIAAFLPAITWEQIVWITPNYSTTPFVSEVSSSSVAQPATSLSTWTYQQVLVLVYLTTALVLFIRLGLQMWKLRALFKRHSSKTNMAGIQYIQTTEKTPPFSFFNTVVYNPSMHSTEELTYVLQHERAHVTNLHSLDMFLANLMVCLNWFNPLAWIYRKRINQNLEFLADEAATQTMTSTKAYQMSLLRTTVASHPVFVVNNFHQSFLKTRIMMLHKNKSPKMAALKLGLILPLLFIFFISCQTKKEQSDAPNQDKTYSYASITQKPKFDGNLKDYISKNLKYPESAKEANIEGNVYVQFTIMQDGSITDVKVLRGKDIGNGVLAKEAVRVIKGMPKWTPGEVNGTKVKVNYIQPFAFNLGY